MTKFTHPAYAPEGHEWTYEGHPVLKIYEGVESLVVVYDAGEEPSAIRTNGKGQTGFGPRVIDAPRERAIWLNLYEDDGYVYADIYRTRERADANETSGRIACVPLTFKDGEGL